MTVAARRGGVPDGLSVPLVVAVLAAALGCLPTALAVTQTGFPVAGFASAGWMGFALAAPLLLDRDPDDRLGRVFAGLATVPLLVAGVAAVHRGPGWRGLTAEWSALGWPVAVLAVAATAWAVDRSGDRMSRRRLTWVVVWSVVLTGSVAAGDRFGDDRLAAEVLLLGLWAFAAALTRVALVTELRPLDEPVLDGLAVVGVAAVGGLAAGAAWAAAGALSLPSPGVTSAFVGLVSVALAAPLAAHLRRRHQERRYGPGVLSAAEVAAITAGLRPGADPRVLLGQAAAMVASASGHRDVRLVLGPVGTDGRPGTVSHELVVDGAPVGSLVVHSGHAEGPEPRQTRIVTQLLPTVALVAQAVRLAVDAHHARQDVSRQRDVERSRILGDLHDEVGPVLAGLSMRVQAELRAHPAPWLDDVAAQLTRCRGDLRRIVSGLTPSALDDGDLRGALQRLADGFSTGGVAVELVTVPTGPLPDEVAVAVYRCVAEGVTNAVRHGGAAVVRLQVSTGREGVRVTVEDDGVGGPVVPCVGLTSLRTRAERLGGHLEVRPREPRGTTLTAVLPGGPW